MPDFNKYNDDPFMRWARIELWSFNVQPVQDMEHYLVPYYFTNMAELINLFENHLEQCRHIRYLVETTLYNYEQIRQIIYN